ncbi:glucosyltransferase domain-containing protein [Pseudomonas putida]|nr:glucosyltransferase domain-containing protein [Pseudomonas putida]
MRYFQCEMDWGEIAKLYAVCLVFGILAYGYNIFNFALSIDGENVDNFHQTISLGRWGHAFIRYYFLPEPFVPYFTNLVSVIFLCLAAVLSAKAIGLENLGLYAFSALFISFPALSYQFEFINQSDTVSIGYFFAVLGAFSFLQREGQTSLTRILLIVFSCLLFIFVTAIYQALIMVPILIVLGRFLLDSYSRVNGFRFYAKNLALFVFIVLFSVFIYSALTIAIKEKFLGAAGASNGYLLHFVNGSGSFAAILNQALINVGAGISGQVRYGFSTYIVATFVAGLVVAGAFLQKKGSYVSRSFLMLGVLFAPFAIIIFSGSYIPGRVLVATNLAFAIIVVNTLRGMVGRMAAIAGMFVAVLFLINISMITALFYSDSATRERDVRLATQITMVMAVNNPDFDPNLVPVYFHGGIRAASQYKIPNSDVFGSSFFTWDYGNNRRLVRFFEYYGFGKFKMATKDQILGIKSKISTMPVWPNPDSIRLVDGVMVVKLNQKPGVLPFVY